MSRKPGWKLVLDVIREHPGVTHRELDEFTGLEAITQRISDARKRGFPIKCERVVDSAGVTHKRYYAVGPEPVQVALFFAEK